ncbi:NADPH-dependent oxidoreductase [Evansella sp. AB-rgal1]|uniref:NADPH-dependent oxidoreductase n=1 Tax=Evansella sp. AB-rgal1 TaxID=3242696 RepID=UPI00359E9962
MNEVIELLNNHRSIRDYKEEAIEEKDIHTIITSAMAGANWVNGQQVSVVEVKDREKKAKLAELVGNQPYVDKAPVFFVFCIDFYRGKLAAEKNGEPFPVVDSVEALLIGSTDVGIAMGNAIAAAESLKLGTVPIGGIRKNVEEVIDLLELPNYVFPISGLVVGYPNDLSATKPRFSLEAVLHKEKYVKENMKDHIDQYDKTISDYMLKRSNGKVDRNWSSGISKYYSEGVTSYMDNITPALKKQGFSNK